MNTNQNILEKRWRLKTLKEEVENASDIMTVFFKEGIEHQIIGCINWPDAYPYKPSVSVALALSRDGKQLLLHFHVEEQEVRAIYTEDNGQVWTDSCVEFFCIPANDGIYYNLECNCIGTILLGAGSTRQNRERASLEILNSIDRWSSLCHKAIISNKEQTCWDIALRIPVSAFFKHNLENLKGASIRANFYKCGDNLEVPHFLSWSPIALPQPNFHCPDFFGTLDF